MTDNNKNTPTDNNTNTNKNERRPTTTPTTTPTTRAPPFASSNVSPAAYSNCVFSAAKATSVFSVAHEQWSLLELCLFVARPWSLQV
jgi:hypothetical protein